MGHPAEIIEAEVIETDDYIKTGNTLIIKRFNEELIDDLIKKMTNDIADFSKDDIKTSMIISGVKTILPGILGMLAENISSMAQMMFSNKWTQVMESDGTNIIITIYSDKILDEEGNPTVVNQIILRPL